MLLSAQSSLLALESGFLAAVKEKKAEPTSFCFVCLLCKTPLHTGMRCGSVHWQWAKVLNIFQEPWYITCSTWSVWLLERFEV